MYAVVGCGDCSALWVVGGRPETTGCPRCGTRHRFERLRRFAETDDEEAARAARSRLLAERSGHGAAFDELGHPAELAERAESAGVTDEEYLGGSGLDVDAIDAAGDAATRGPHASRGSRRTVVTEAFAELDRPTEDDVVRYAAERGVPEPAARELVERLVRSGRVSRAGDGLRLL